MTWVQTYSGVAFELLAPRAEDVRAADLAHALAHSCRFGGHTRSHYSVAQHSALVAALVWQRTRDLGATLLGLLHDAHEAYTGDIKKPVKWAIEAVAPGALRAIEGPIDAAIFAWAGDTRLGMGAPAEQVKRADAEILLWERDAFLGQPPTARAGEHLRERIGASDFGVTEGATLLDPWPAQIAERVFLYALSVMVPHRAPRDVPVPPAWLFNDLRRALPCPGVAEKAGR